MARKRKSPFGNFFSKIVNTIRNTANNAGNAITGDELNKLRREVSGLNQTIHNPVRNTKGEVVNMTAKQIEQAVSNDHDFINKLKIEPFVEGMPSGLQGSTEIYKALAHGYATALTKQDTELTNATTENNLLKNSPSGDYSVLFTAVKTQNNNIQNQINELQDTYSTDNQKANYQSEKILTLKRINYVLLIIYYMALLVLGLVLVMFNTTLSKQKKVIIIILLMIFPFISDIIYQLLAYIYNFTYATLNGNAYTSNNY